MKKQFWSIFTKYLANVYRCLSLEKNRFFGDLIKKCWPNSVKFLLNQKFSLEVSYLKLKSHKNWHNKFFLQAFKV